MIMKRLLRAEIYTLATIGLIWLMFVSSAMVFVSIGFFVTVINPIDFGPSFSLLWFLVNVLVTSSIIPLFILIIHYTFKTIEKLRYKKILGDYRERHRLYKNS